MQSRRSWSFYLGTAVVCRPLTSAWNMRSHSIRTLSLPLCSLPHANYQNLCHLNSMPLAKAWLNMGGLQTAWFYLVDSGCRNYVFCRIMCWKVLFL
jgi:hypothetical protein